MRKVVARNVSYRIVAAIFLALGVGWHFWYDYETVAPETRIEVRPLPEPKTLSESRALSRQFYYGERLHTCAGIAAYRFLQRATQLREQVCLLESEQARKDVKTAWAQKKALYFEIQYRSCPECRTVYDVLIEQNSSGSWQITIKREFDQVWDHEQPGESVAVALKRRPATINDDYEHVIGENLLVFLDASGKELLAF